MFVVYKALWSDLPVMSVQLGNDKHGPKPWGL